MMRTKFLFLTVLCLFSFSCHEDDDDDDNNQEIENFAITNENNFYMGNLYIAYLEGEIITKTDEIASLNMQLIQDPNNQQLQAQLNLAETQLETLQNQEIAQINIEALLLGIPKIPRPPVPPMPCTSGACIPNILDYITIYNNFQEFSIIFRNLETEEEIISIGLNEFTSLPQYNNIISTTAIDFGGFSGEFSAEIQSVNVNNQVANYNISGHIY